MKNNSLHLITAAGAVALLVLLTDPFMYWMPPLVAMIALLGATVLLLVWAGLVMREQAGDEREAMHRMHAGRIAYLSGVGVLTLALLVQGLSHHIDIWIALALGTMVVAKAASHFYTDRYN